MNVYELFSNVEAYNNGYNDAIEELNTPMDMIVEKYNPSVCPRCHKGFDGIEECNDGYYNRATNLSRCPYCGQKISWDNV